VLHNEMADDLTAVATRTNAPAKTMADHLHRMIGRLPFSSMAEAFRTQVRIPPRQKQVARYVGSKLGKRGGPLIKSARDCP